MSSLSPQALPDRPLSPALHQKTSSIESFESDRPKYTLDGPSKVSSRSSSRSSKSTHQIAVENNVFYNEETLKYMRIIDMYKKLGVGKDIELPRVCCFMLKFED